MFNAVKSTVSLISLGFGVIGCFVLFAIVSGIAYSYFPTMTEIALWIIAVLVVLAIVGWFLNILLTILKQFKYFFKQ